MPHVHVDALVLFLLISSIYQVLGTFVTTNTHAGIVRGYRVSIPSGGELDIFLGIPFAEPPVGDLRFAPPVEKRHWRPRVLNATEFGAVCPQRIQSFRSLFGNGYIKIDEDCLYLNIYAPKSINHPVELLPVMVWIHGGSYDAGSGSGYDGRILAARGEVVVVTLNYRLGALGFLSTFDSNAVGNQALLDQVLALKWVQRNIHGFGGDPDQVTIFGESAGGAAVSLHMFSPLSEGLFHALITQSGCALSPFAIYRPPYSQLNTTRSLAQLLDCPTSSSREMIKCLRTKSAQDIVEVEPMHPKLSLAFAPRVDGYFLHDVPENLLKRGEFHHNIRVMTGFVHDETSIFIPNVFDKSGGYDVHLYESFLGEISSGFLHREKVQSTLICQYPPAINNTRKNVETFMQLVSDYEIRIPNIHMSADLTTKGVPTWMYEFNYLSAHYPQPEWKGVYHSSELYFVFGAPLFNSMPCPGLLNTTCPQKWETNTTWDSEDVRISDVLIDIWGLFAHLRSTNGASLILPNGDVWNPFDERKQFLSINSTLEIQNNPREQMLAFWDKFEYLNFYADPDPDSHCV